jgi:TolB-like protein/Tfp pilus assembly protein PilF
LNLRNFFAELKRRNVYRVAIAYALIAWLLMQIATQVFPFLEIPKLGGAFARPRNYHWISNRTRFGVGVRVDSRGNQTRGRCRAYRSARAKSHVWIYIAITAGALSVGLFLLGRYTAPRGMSLPAKSIAVLPFENLSSDPDNAYFADGVQDDILTRLAKIGDLKVIARSSTQRYKSSGEDLREVGRQLGVGHVLEGTVQKAANNVRVRVQLINAATATHLWAETYDRKLTDIFAVESDIATKVAGELQAKLTRPEQSALSVRPTESAEAYQLYLLGRYFWNKRTAADLKKAIGYFHEAIENDPNYATAYAGLADAYVLLSGYGDRPKDTFPQAKVAAMKALELDSTLGQAHAALALALFASELNFAEASREFQRAIELNPNYATAHQWYGEAGLLPLGKFDEAIAELKRALELDPLSIIINADVGRVLGGARRYDEAIAQLRKTVEMDPNFYYARWGLGESLEMKELNERSRRAIQEGNRA